MHRIRVYVDTSVFGGAQDDEFAQASCQFFKRVRAGEYTVLLSNETLRELAMAPQAVRNTWMDLPDETLEMVPINTEVTELAASYVENKVVGEASLSDALHVAAATVAGADLILSWNFKHIVNFARICAFNSVNVTYGYRSMTILSPLEVTYDGEE